VWGRTLQYRALVQSYGLPVTSQVPVRSARPRRTEHPLGDVNLREDEMLPCRNERSSSAMQNGGKHPDRRERTLR
jgi:hypothetical protein